MTYRMHEDIDIHSLCGQPLRLQIIQDRGGNGMLIAIREDHTVVTIAHEIRTRAKVETHSDVTNHHPSIALPGATGPWPRREETAD